MNAHYWIVVRDSAGSGYFVRFDRHFPKPRWYKSRSRERAYCFASVEDAQRVVDQLQLIGYSAKIVPERPKPTPKTPPVQPVQPSIPTLPLLLREWVDKILSAADATNENLSTAARIKSGYRTLARQCHPDVGGATSDMQRLTDAHKWLQQNSVVAVEHFSMSAIFTDDWKEDF